jgi:hypothetical protein
MTVLTPLLARRMLSAWSAARRCKRTVDVLALALRPIPYLRREGMPMKRPPAPSRRLVPRT